ncbi:hypothetical protein D9615_009697 [Tricholomella constricta]|uniref:DUF6534 domain-containing protein n=1 Tax=Tricholomella constricta TaxID=117010 RepID=A0A8H5LW12_9AGAR|nr:hypothetical protein D9615_009697 [Tricholomella constricta]
MAETRMAENIDANMGSMLIGVIVSAVLLGISLVQTFYYYINYPKDPWYLRSLVAVTAVFDMVHLGMISHTVYHYLISNYNNPRSLELLVWSVLMEALFTGVTGALVQCFYLTRVWLLSNKSIFLTVFILLIVLANAGLGTVWVVLSMQLETYDELLTISPITISINALSAAADVLIAASLCIMLHRARTGFKRSDSMINRLMLFVVNTGVLTSCCAVASLISLIASPLTLVYASFYFCIGRLYTNSFLATLNARRTLTGKVDDVSHMLVSIPPTLLNTHHSGGQKKSQANISIRIDTTHERDANNVMHISHRGHSKLDMDGSDDDLTQVHDGPPRSMHAKDREPLDFQSTYVV